MSKGIWKRKSNSKKGKSGNVLKVDIRARKILIQRVGAILTTAVDREGEDQGRERRQTR